MSNSNGDELSGARASGRTWPDRFRARGVGWDLLILLLLALLALIPRLYRIESAPPGLNGDELFNAIDALRLGPGSWQVYFEGNNGREALFLYLMALPLTVFGQEVWALRLPAVLLGTGSVLLAYLIGKHFFNRRVGFIAGALMAVSLWPIMQARWGLRAVSLTFFTALTIYLYGRIMHREGRTIGGWLAAGLSLGLSLYTYVPARLFPLVILGWFGWTAILRIDWIRRQWRNILLSFAVALLVFIPLGLYIVRYPDKYDQRVGGLLESAQFAAREDPGVLLDKIVSVPLMFTFSGDTAGRYHPDARPVFDPVTSLFFYLGMAATIWLAFRRGAGPDRRAAHGLLLLWSMAMLAPNLILGADTSFLRGAGAIAPIYLITAIGVDTIYSLLCRRWPNRRDLWRWGLVGIVSVGITVTLIDSWRAYFQTWVNDPVTRDAWHADLGLIGGYLTDHPPPPGSEIFIAYNYVADSSPQGFAYYSDEPVTWFDHKNSFAWRPGSDSNWYLTSSVKPIDAEVVDRLVGASTVLQVNYENDEKAFTLYRVKPDDIDWVPENEFELRFENSPRLIGYDLPAELFRGDIVRLISHWQVSPGQAGLPNRLTYVQARLEDASGNVWSQSESLLGYPQSGWNEGDRFVQFLQLEIPKGMPPGSAFLRFGLRDWDGTPYAVIPESEDADGGKKPLAGPVLVRSRPLDEVVIQPGAPVFEDTLALQGHTFSTLIAPGLPLNISLEWLALKQPEVDYKIQLHLSILGNPEPIYVQTFELWPDTYPPSQWGAGEQVTTFHRLDIPLTIPTGADPILQIQVQDPSDSTPLLLTEGDNTLANMELSLRDHLFERPPMENSVAVRFGDDITLLGYDLDVTESTPGGEVRLTLYWQAIDTPAAGYTVFNHLVGPDGGFQGQFDSPPESDAWLTSTWLPGEIIADRRTIPIKPTAQSIPYELIIGLYTADDLTRLPVYLDGKRQDNDQLVLTEVLAGP